MPWSETAPGSSLYYEETDHQDPWLPSSDTVVLIHGMAESHEVWRSWLPYLSRHHRVVAIDLPGFGRSRVDKDYPWSLDNCAGEIIQLLADLGVVKAHFVGAKAGGAIALTLACRYPDWTESVVSLTGPLWSESEDGVVHQKDIGQRVLAAGARAWAQQTMEARLGKDVDPAQLAWWVTLMARTNPNILARAAAASARLDLRHQLRLIRGPALMITSDGSPLSRDEVVGWWHQEVPQARSIVFRRDGYHIAAIEPDACAQIVSPFLRRDEPGFDAACLTVSGRVSRR